MNNPVSRTAYYTLGVRAWDASLPKPICGDTFAQEFMTDEARKVWEEFKNDLRPNSSNAARHAIIDHHLQEALDQNPDERIVIIGAGFDTRAFRLRGGRWIEVDEEAIITIKEKTLRASRTKNPLTRIAINFATESLKDKLLPFQSQTRTHVIIEGVFMYLDEQQRKSLLDTLKELFRDHIVYCDLMKKSFFEKYSKPIHERILALGATFTDLQEQPEELFLRNGYSEISRTSVPLYAAKHGDIRIPAMMIRFFLKILREGYQIYRFGFRS